MRSIRGIRRFILVLFAVILPPFIYWEVARESSSTVTLLRGVDYFAFGKSGLEYDVFFNRFLDYWVTAPTLFENYATEKAPEIMPGNDKILLSKSKLESVLNIDPATLEKLKDSHQRFVDVEINKLINEDGLSTFGTVRANSKAWNLYHGSKGYVLIGGGKYSWLLYLTIRQLRLAGSELPAQLFMPMDKSKDRDSRFCDEIMPRLGVECIYLDAKLETDLVKKYKVRGFQYKMLALMHSKFENVLYIDSDNAPVRNIDSLFEESIYRQTGLVVWPDAWSRTTNPKWYDIAGVTVHENKERYSPYDYAEAKRGGAEKPKPLLEYTFEESHFHDFENTLPTLTSEAGMVLVNKTKHLRTLLLCLYYNMLGPDFYYPLLTQGSAGEGDKDTFGAAAHALGEPWYQVEKAFWWVGYHSKDSGEFGSKALGHWDPQQVHEKNALEEDPGAYATTGGPKADDIDVVFMHMLYPKWYPDWLQDQNQFQYSDGEDLRMYESIAKNVGYDFDLRMVSILVPALCHGHQGSDGGLDELYIGDYLHYIHDNRERHKKWCEAQILPHFEWLKESTKWPQTVLG